VKVRALDLILGVKMTTGFEDVSTETLEKIQKNLISGLDKVAETIKNGTFKKLGPKGESSPAEFGHVTLALLNGVTAELQSRKRKNK
jgi:hypothetical protein